MQPLPLSATSDSTVSLESGQAEQPHKRTIVAWLGMGRKGPPTYSDNPFLKVVDEFVDGVRRENDRPQTLGRLEASYERIKRQILAFGERVTKQKRPVSELSESDVVMMVRNRATGVAPWSLAFQLTRFLKFLRAKGIVKSAPENPFADLVEAFCSKFEKTGYSRATSWDYRKDVLLWGAHLNSQGRSICDVSEIDIDEALRGNRAFRHRSALVRFLQFLREEGTTTTTAMAVPAPIEFPIVRDYCEFLKRDRGLGDDTIKGARYQTIQFLRSLSQPLMISELTVDEIHQHVRLEAKRVGGKTAQAITSNLRRFFRFLFLRRLHATDHSVAVPTVAVTARLSPPRYISEKQVSQLVRSIREHGLRRDYAIILLMIRLGLRPCEIRNLRLGDINWPTQTMTVRGKGSSGELQFDDDVKSALGDYIENERFECDLPQVFLQSKMPVAPIRGIYTVINAAFERAKITAEKRGPYTLRHTFATHLLQSGATLFDVGEVLRHKDPATSMVYAKVGLRTLRTLAMPWPGRTLLAA